MDKETLRKAAEQLMEAEYLCRKAYAQADKAGWAKFEEAQQNVKKLTESVMELQRSIPELSSKRYWWETPFHPQEQVDTTGFRFDDGKYLECDSVSLREESHGTFLYQKPKNIDYNSLSLEFTLGTNIPLFINRKQLRNHLNDWMNCRYLYDTVLIRREVQVVPDLTRKKESASAAWKQYQQMEKEKRAEYQEYLKSHNETWDQMEKFRHLSLFTNEERWLMGQMDTDDYIREDNWRNYATYGQRDKMREELAYMNLQASKASQDVRQRQMEVRRNALRMSASENLIRMFPVGHIVYCGNEIMAIFLHKEKVSVLEHECASNVCLENLEGQCFNSWHLADETPALIPVIKHLAKEYNDSLPKFSVLAVRPQNCPEELWRVWMAARWEQRKHPY